MDLLKNHGKPWNKKYVGMLLNAYSKTQDIAAIARYLQRTEVAVQMKLNDILPTQKGLSPLRGVAEPATPAVVASYDRWDSEDDGLLADLHHVEPVEEIAEQLGRSVGAIQSRVRHLKLDEPPLCKWDWLQLEDWMGCELPDWR